VLFPRSLLLVVVVVIVIVIVFVVVVFILFHFAIVVYVLLFFLPQTFMTVSLANVSSHLNFRSELEAEKYIRDIVRRGRGRPRPITHHH